MIAFSAIVADCFYGDNHGLEATLLERGLPHVLAHRGSVGRGWAPSEGGHTERWYELRNWIKQGYKQMKNELGWADFMVRSDRAIRRHWTLVLCAFSFCWWLQACQARTPESSTPPQARKKNQQRQGAAALAKPAACGARLADSGALACGLLGRTLRVRHPSTELASLLGAFTAGHGINLYLRL